jgi:hypothetical protein
MNNQLLDTDVLQKTFLAAYAETGSVRTAAKAAQISRTSHKNWLPDPAYAAAFADAKEDAIETLEGIARERAIRERNPSDVLLIFLLKGLRPEMYRENATIQHAGAGGGPLTIEVIFREPLVYKELAST